MVQRTPEKATTVKLAFRNIRVKESVVAVSARMSSEMRWSGFDSSPVACSRK